MPNRVLRHVALLAGLAWMPAVAQSSGGTITGVVRDAAAQPVAGADVSARPGEHRTKTDSAGRFTFTDLGPDSYSVHARKLGFAPESWDAKLSKSGRLDITIVLARRMPLLDTVIVLADGKCPQLYSIEAFMCRRHRPSGVFLDYTDIDDKDVKYAGELFRDIPGFFVDFRISQFGPAYQVRTVRPSGCINSLVNGRPVTGANVIPELSSTVIALEIYARPDSVPPELERFTWPQSGVGRSGRCMVVVYWTDGGIHGSVGRSFP